MVGSDISSRALFVNIAFYKCLKSSIQVALVDGRFQFVVVSRLESCREANGWNTKDHWIYVVIEKAQKPITVCGATSYGRSWNALAYLVLSNFKLWYVLETMLTNVKRFEQEYFFALLLQKERLLRQTLGPLISASKKIWLPAYGIFGRQRLSSDALWCWYSYRMRL